MTNIITKMMATRLNENNFVKKTKIEILPEYFECPICFMVKDNIMECRTCKARACAFCLEDFSKAEYQKNP